MEYKSSPSEHVLSEYKNSYFGNLYYRKLNCQKDQGFYNTIKECFQLNDGKHYDLNPVDWFKADVGLESGNTQKTNTFFCSALIGYVYCSLGFF